MGWDLQYHPFRAQEVVDIYFRCLDDPDHYRCVGRTFALQEEPTEQLGNFLDSVRKMIATTGGNPPGRFHMFAIAAVAGFLRKYWYVRGSALSFLPDEILEKYITDWSDLIPGERANGPFTSRLEENYAGGVFLTPEALRRLRDDYVTNDTLRKHLDDLFSHGRLAVFWQAADFAIEHNVGLIEASEVTEPNPLDLNESSSKSFLLNCQTEGVLLYAEAVAEQMREVQETIKQAVKQQGQATASPAVGEQGLIRRPPGLLRRLFGKKPK